MQLLGLIESMFVISDHKCTQYFFFFLPQETQNILQQKNTF